LEHRVKIFGVALLSLCVAFSSEALTLGRVRGAVLIGRPLDVVVPVQMDAGEDASSLCFEADVFHADARQDASRVRVVVEATAQPQMGNLRILSSTLIDEPVVTLYLRTGCGPKTSRRYVLLADLPSDVAAPSIPLVLPASTQLVAKVNSTPVAPVSTANAQAVLAPKQTIPRKTDHKPSGIRAAVAARQSAMADINSTAVRPAGQSRLKLDPLELLSDRVANLDSFMTFAPPEDALRNSQKVQTLEGDVKALLALAAKNEASLVDLRVRLQKAETERFPSGTIYGLIALLLACLAAVALLWRRQRRAQAGDGEWWSGSVASPALPADEVNSMLHPEPLTARQGLNQVPLAGKHRTAPVPESSNDSVPSTGVDVNLTEMSDSNFGAFMRSGVAQAVDRQPPLPPLPATATRTRPVQQLNDEAASDIRQQAEFFVSLGQTDLAAQILKKQTNESDVPDPFVFLDLLSIYHALGLKTDFQQVREDFHRLFSARVPEFAFFKDEGRDLESYPDVLSRVSALWPAPKVLEVIETCIFRDAQDAVSQSFDLAAFRDLLLLHAVAQSVVLGSPSAEGKPRVAGQSDGVSRDQEVPPSHLLDLDLSDLDMGELGSDAASPVDIDLPLLMPVDLKFDAQGADATRSQTPKR
jgi:pilus assembly protein FimV